MKTPSHLRGADAFVSAVVWLFAAAGATYAADYHVIPYDVDPPIQVDGELGDWAEVPNPIELQRREQVTYGADMWNGLDDLSGIVRLAYRYGGLFVAAEVTDECVNQPYRGRDIWKGDHLNLWVDLTPGQEPRRHMFGAGQFHVVVSPGNLGGVDGKDAVTPPEIHVYRPEGLPSEGGEVCARRTARGYVIEAFIPWSRLGVKEMKMHQDANFEVAFSEADGAPARQETLMTILTEKWVYSRERLCPVVFGDGNGVGKAPLRAVPMADAVELAPGKSSTLALTLDTIPADKELSVFLKARCLAKSVTGVRPRALALALNGTRLGPKRLSNRPVASRFFEGTLQTFVDEDGALAVYCADGHDRPPRSKRYALMDYAQGSEFEFEVTDLVVAGENRLRLENLMTSETDDARSILLGDVALRMKARAIPLPTPKPAPTGALPIVEPRTTFARTWSALHRMPESVSLSVAGETFTVTSRFSAPDGEWHSGSNRFYAHQRSVSAHDEHIVVRDTFRNLTEARVPIMQEHRCELGERLRRVWLGGYRVKDNEGRKSTPQNPTVFGTTEGAGIGLFPDNDEFLVHVRMEAEDGTLILADREFVLAAGASYSAEWVIVPVPEPEFWTFINQARRVRDVNFTLQHTFAFMSQIWPVTMWTDEQFKAFIDNKSADLVVLSNNLAKVQGRYPRCTEMYNADLKAYHDFITRLRRLYPDRSVQAGVYYHCFLDTTPANVERFAADRALDAHGNHANYGGKGHRC